MPKIFDISREGYAIVYDFLADEEYSKTIQHLSEDLFFKSREEHGQKIFTSQYDVSVKKKEIELTMMVGKINPHGTMMAIGDSYKEVEDFVKEKNILAEERERLLWTQKGLCDKMLELGIAG